MAYFPLLRDNDGLPQEPTSVAEFGIATALLLVVTLGATLLPARRAACTHPAVTRRGE